MTTRDSELDAVVVGSGPNGLAAAVTLAREGLSVLVLEAAATPGGGARTEELTLPGFRHDPCAAVLPLGVGSPFFAGLPLERHGLTWIHPDQPLAHVMDGVDAVALHRDVGATAAGLGEDGDAWQRLFAPIVDEWPRLAPELLAPVHVPRHPIALARFGWSAIQPAERLARARFRGEPARALFAGLAAHSFLSLDRWASASFGLVLGALGHVVGWPFPRGGTGALTEALVAHLHELGGRVETGVRVGALRELPASRAVLLDLTPRQVVAIAGDRLPLRYARSLTRYRYGPAAFKLDWALDGPVPWTSTSCARAGVVHVGGTLGEIAASERAPWVGRVSDRPFVLLAQPTLFDATRAPAGRHVAWGYCHVPHGWTGDATDAIESQVERFAPGFRDRILARNVMGPTRLEARDANLVGGDINGGVQDLGQMFTRPVVSLAPHATPVPGLYLCSASTPPGGGVHGMCGYHAARVALKRTFGRS